MEKKAETATSQPLGVCEKLYNAFTPSLAHFRRPRLTTGGGVSVAGGNERQSASHAQEQSRSPTPVAPLAKASGDTTQEKDNHVVPPAAKANGRGEVVAPEKEKAATHKVGNSVTQQRSSLTAEKRKVDPPAPSTAVEKVTAAPSIPPPIAAEKVKAAPSIPPTIAAEKVKAAPSIPPPIAAEKVKAAPPIVPPTVSVINKGQPAPPVAPPLVAAEKGKEPPVPQALQKAATEKNKVTSASTAMEAEKKTASSGWSMTNINDKSEDFIRRAKSGMRAISNIGAGGGSKVNKN